MNIRVFSALLQDRREVRTDTCTSAPRKSSPRSPFCPQGSAAIDATISHRGTDDEYDLDIVAELDIDPAAAPDEVLDLLHRAFKGYALLLDVQRPLSLGTS